MPRNGLGGYTLPAGNPVVDGTTITTTWGNTTMSDIGAEITNSLCKDGQTPLIGPLRFTDGTVSLPGIAFNSEAGLGVYRVSSGVLGFAVGGVQKLSITSSTTTISNDISITGNSTVGGNLTVTGSLTQGGYAVLTTATTLPPAASLTGGSAGTLPYQSAAGVTAMLAAGTAGYVLQANGTAAPSWISPSTFTVSAATSATSATTATTVTGTIGSAVTATTQAAGDSSTKVATTAFVDALRDITGNTQSTSYTLALADRGKSIDTTAGVTVPPNSSVAFPTYSTVSITNTSGSAITITQGSGVTLRLAGTTSTGNRTLGVYGVCTLRKIATDTWIMSGAGVT